MTEGQRDYLADLAGKKGVRIEDTGDVSQAWASKKIDELKALPDAVFDPVSDVIIASIDKQTEAIMAEMKRWTFQA